MKELNEIELREVEGGFLGLDDFFIGITVGAVIAVINDWDNFERGFTGKPYQK